MTNAALIEKKLRKAGCTPAIKDGASQPMVVPGEFTAIVFNYAGVTHVGARKNADSLADEMIETAKNFTKPRPATAALTRRAAPKVEEEASSAVANADTPLPEEIVAMFQPGETREQAIPRILAVLNTQRAILRNRLDFGSASEEDKAGLKVIDELLGKYARRGEV